MAPAQQRFDTDGTAVVIVLQLIEQFQLVAVDRLAKFVFQLGPLTDLGLNLRVVEAQSVAPGFLGLIFGQLCLAQQRLAFKLSVGKQCDADTDGEEVAEIIDLVFTLQTGSDALGNLLGLPCCQRTVALRQLNQNRKLIAANPCQQIALTQQRANLLCQLKQAMVTGLMTVQIIQQLEAIQIDPEI